MSDRFQIKYDVVYSKTAGLRSRIEAELSEMDTAYRQAQSDLHGLDGKANAVLMETMERNQEKAHVTAETLHKLLTFIELSSRQVEHDELKMKGMYSMAGAGGPSSLGTGATTATETTAASSSTGEESPTTATQGGAS